MNVLNLFMYVCVCTCAGFVYVFLFVCDYNCVCICIYIYIDIYSAIVLHGHSCVYHHITKLILSSHNRLVVPMYQSSPYWTCRWKDMTSLFSSITGSGFTERHSTWVLKQKIGKCISLVYLWYFLSLISFRYGNLSPWSKTIFI